MKTVVIGNGISGVSCARQLRKLDSQAEILLVSDESDYFFSRTALMYIFMGHMTLENTQPYESWFWDKNRIQLKKAWVQKIESSSNTIHYSNGESEYYDHLVLALGSKSNMFGWKGQDLDGVQGLYSLQDLELLEENCQQNVKRAVLVGGGLIGVELAEMLLTRNIEVTFLVRESHFWGNVLPKQESELIRKHMVNDHHVDLRLNTNLVEIVGDDAGRVKGVKTDVHDEIIPCELVGLTAGVSPNIDLAKTDPAIACDKGVVVDRFLRTSVSNIYAIGDCAQQQIAIGERRNIEQVWYTGRMMGEALGKTLAGHETAYQPGNWFNSAKFFDIEYQTYGWVWANLKEGTKAFYWESPDHLKCLHLVFKEDDLQFLGLNVFGIRLRHELVDKLLTEKASVEKLLAMLPDLNFDPELYRNNFKEIVASFNKTFDREVKLRKKSLRSIFKASR